MANLSLQADSACAIPVPSTGFDPAQWLETFKNTGGWWISGTDGRVSMGWHVYGYSDEQNQEARRALRSLSDDPVQVAAVRQHLASLFREA